MTSAPPVSALAVEGEHLCGLTWLEGLLWYSDSGLDEILAVDAASGEVVRRLPCPGVRTGLSAAADGTRLVQVVGPDKRLRALDLDTGQTLEESPNPRPGGELCGLCDTAAGLWMGYQHPPVLDLRSHSDHKPILSIEVAEDVADITVADRFVVFANHPDARLNVVDPDAGRIVDTIQVDGGPTGLTWDGSRLWYCDYGAGRLRPVELNLDELLARA